MHLALARLFTWIVDDYFAYTVRLALAWLVMRLVARLVVDYFDYAARPGASARRGLVTRLVAPLVVDYFDYAAHPGASARRAARHAARRAARRRLLRLRRASGCLGTSRGSSCGFS
jgi:hypothetical protein